MPKATLTFNLPEENSEFNTAINANKFAGAIADIKQILRKYRKYIELDPTESAFFDKLDDEFCNILKDLPEEE